MSNNVNTINEQYEIWKAEDAKFSAGNNAAGTRARKALGEISKAIRERRKEIATERNARKEAKKA